MTHGPARVGLGAVTERFGTIGGTLSCAAALFAIVVVVSALRRDPALLH